MDKSVLSRITKALNLANHPGTGEQEAKAALRCVDSSHSLTKLNLTVLTTLVKHG